MNKHKFNVFPEMSGEDYQKLIEDLRTHGFDSSQPIVIFENAILDGWNRFKACQELDIPFVERQFYGTSMDAINFVMRTNKRRNLNSQQWAAIAVEADDFIQAITEETEQERKVKQSESLKETYRKGEFGVCNNKLLQTEIAENKEVSDLEVDNQLDELVYEYDEPKRDPNKNAVSTKLAQTFNTNRAYINEAKKLKETFPEKLHLDFLVHLRNFSPRPHVFSSNPIHGFVLVQRLFGQGFVVVDRE